jgi:hypothetical protein
VKPISDERRRRLLIVLHRAIKDAATRAADAVAGGGDPQISYPPGHDLSEEEVRVVAELRMSGTARSVVRKIVADAAASAAFRLFCVMDAVGDPEDGRSDEIWHGAMLAEPDEDDHPMLHDAFFDTYEDYQDEVAQSKDPTDDSRHRCS